MTDEKASRLRRRACRGDVRARVGRARWRRPRHGRPRHGRPWHGGPRHGGSRHGDARRAVLLRRPPRARLPGVVSSTFRLPFLLRLWIPLRRRSVLLLSVRVPVLRPLRIRISPATSAGGAGIRSGPGAPVRRTVRGSTRGVAGDAGRRGARELWARPAARGAGRGIGRSRRTVLDEGGASREPLGGVTARTAHHHRSRRRARAGGTAGRRRARQDPGRPFHPRPPPRLKSAPFVTTVALLSSTAGGRMADLLAVSDDSFEQEVLKG